MYVRALKTNRSRPLVMEDSMRRYFSLYQMLTLDVVLPLLVVEFGLGAGLAPVMVLAVAALFPFTDTVIGIARTRAVSIIAAVSLLAILAGIALALTTGNAVFAILKDSAFTLILSAIFLGSLATREPLIYRLYSQMLDERGRLLLETLWQERPLLVQSFRLMTLVWGVGLLAEAVVRFVVTLTAPVATAAAASPWIAFGCIGTLITWTVLYSRARRRAAARAGLALP